jgi:hypothetical protein
MFKKPSIILELKELLDYIACLETCLNCLRGYIRRNLSEIIRISSPNDLDTLVWFGFISAEEVPEDKRTKFIENRLKGMKQ